MNKKTAELIWRYANLIHENLCYHTDCFNADGTLKSVKYIACIDDDPKSAIYAAWLYYKAIGEGQSPKILCIGGTGLLSKHLKKKGVKRYTEGMRLAEVCRQMGIEDDKIIILDHGTNSGENVRDVARLMLKDLGDIVFAVTKRLSLRWERTFKKQIGEQMAKLMSKKARHEFSPSLMKTPMSYYYVIEETLEEACSWMNGKRVGKCQMMFQELASILRACNRRKFQLPLEHEPSSAVKEANAYLSKYYRIKLGKRGPREICQYLYLLYDLKKHLPDMQREQKEAIQAMLKKIKHDFHIEIIHL